MKRKKMEREDVEKNRSKYMKNLHNQLYSLLPPTHVSQETMELAEQIDATEKYIKGLEMKLEKSKMYLEQLRPKSLNSTNGPSPSTESPPQIQVHEMGPNMVVVLITSLDNIATFNNIIRLFHEEGVEVVFTQFQLNGNSMFQLFHETKNKRISTMEFSATTLKNKLTELIYGLSYGNDVESNL
ncbi:hypothetical protein P3S67_020643 [Capsicum chacoense]